MSGITLDAAAKIVDLALQKARSDKMMPLAVAVLDPRGQLKAFKAEDNSSLMRADIAIGKAWGALALGFGGREIARRSQAMPGFIAAMQALAGGRMIPVPGGVLIRDKDGILLGAVGVSGDKSDNDELAALTALAAVGLRGDTGDPA